MSCVWLTELLTLVASVITIGQFVWPVVRKTTQRCAKGQTVKPAAKLLTLDDVIYNPDTWAGLRERLESTGRLA
jgi:hypothetical protein